MHKLLSIQWMVTALSALHIHLHIPEINQMFKTIAYDIAENILECPWNLSRSIRHMGQVILRTPFWEFLEKWVL